MSIQAVLFDLDGTLLDSAPDIHAAFSAAAVSEGLRAPTMAQVRPLIGLPLVLMFRGVYGEIDDAAAQALAAAYRSHFRGRPMDLTRVFPGAEAALSALLHLRRAVATTKRTPQAEHALSSVGLRDYFDHVQGTDDFPAKPAPDVLLRCAAALGCAPAQAVYVGDGPWDMQAAKAAGMAAIGIDHEGLRREDLLAAGAARVLSHLGDLPRLFKESSSGTILDLTPGALSAPPGGATIGARQGLPLPEGDGPG